MLLAFIMVPLVQKELDVFRETVWNTHRIRAQKDTVLPDGIPDNIYNFPEQYDLEDCDFVVTEEQLEKVAKESGVLRVPEDFLTEEFRGECEHLTPLNQMNGQLHICT
ncbi:unnamed protein product [Pocillopora meandrina]|uniref:Uncharacterized protein n=1 Tax=Pocillopora meandrina TaxID=46732 RepID=A0AAU9Y051_9CNID|nr:unnamed protein product [Pocillopora meandrina]